MGDHKQDKICAEYSQGVRAQVKPLATGEF